MSEQENDSDDGLVIKIPASFFKKHDAQSKESPKATHDYDFFKRTNIVPTEVILYREYGKTKIQSLGFVKPDQRSKVLELLNGHGLYNKLPDLLEYIYQLGCESDAEKRYYAGVAISELASSQPFLDLKEAVILRWANNENLAIRNSAAVALSQLLRIDRNKSEVLKLLKHWVSLNNPMLTGVALSTFYWIANFYPHEAIEAIGVILKNRNNIHYSAVIDLFGTVYDNSPSLAIDKLYIWLLPVNDSDLCRIAGELSFGIQLDDAIEDEGTRKKVVEMIFTLWDNPRMPLHEEMQERTTILIEIWASEAVERMNKGSSSDQKQKLRLAFFHELYKKFEGRRNRLEFYLQRWEKNKERSHERSRLRAIRRGGDTSVCAKDKFGYCHLLPQGLY